MTKSQRKNVPDVGIELEPACMPSEHASDRATAPGCIIIVTMLIKWRAKHGNSEKVGYLQIGGSNIDIYSRNKGLCCLVGGGGEVLNFLWGRGEGHKHFCHISRGSRFPAGLWGV